MEQDLDSVLACETVLTQLKDPIQAFQILFDKEDQKQILHQFERQVLIPFMQNHSHYDLFVKACNNDAKAQVQLGHYFCDHDDIDNALVWYRKAAALNDVDGYLNVCVVFNRPFTNDEYKEAIDCATKGYSLGSMECWNFLAILHYYEHNYNGMFNIWSRLVQQDIVFPMWQQNYGDCFRDGHGTKKDVQVAQEWYDKAKQNKTPVVLNVAKRWKINTCDQ